MYVEAARVLASFFVTVDKIFGDDDAAGGERGVPNAYMLTPDGLDEEDARDGADGKRVQQGGGSQEEEHGEGGHDAATQLQGQTPEPAEQAESPGTRDLLDARLHSLGCADGKVFSFYQDKGAVESAAAERGEAAAGAPAWHKRGQEALGDGGSPRSLALSSHPAFVDNDWRFTNLNELVLEVQAGD